VCPIVGTSDREHPFIEGSAKLLIAFFERGPMKLRYLFFGVFLFYWERNKANEDQMVVIFGRASPCADDSSKPIWHWLYHFLVKGAWSRLPLLLGLDTAVLSAIRFLRAAQRFSMVLKPLATFLGTQLDLGNGRREWISFNLPMTRYTKMGDEKGMGDIFEGIKQVLEDSGIGLQSHFRFLPISSWDRRREGALKSICNTLYIANCIWHTIFNTL